MEAQTFELKTPYLKTGRSHNILPVCAAAAHRAARRWYLGADGDGALRRMTAALLAGWMAV